MTETAAAIMVGFLFAYYARFFLVYIVRPEWQKNPLRRMTRLELWLQRQRHKYAQYDLQRLVNVSLGCVIVVWLIYIVIFKPVMP